jgi:hypothetical protein
MVLISLQERIPLRDCDRGSSFFFGGEHSSYEFIQFKKKKMNIKTPFACQSFRQKFPIETPDGREIRSARGYTDLAD